MNWIKTNVFFFLLLISQLSEAQTRVLTLEEAIQTGLTQNLGINVSRNDIQIAANNAVKGNAGFLPNINLIASETPSFGYLNQKLSSGTEINRTNLTNNVTAGVQLNWVLYDGRRMHFELDRLRELQGLTEINLRVRSEQIVYDIMRAYFSIVRHQELFNSLQEQMNLFEERFRIAQTRVEVGTGNQLDVYQAQTDLNVQRTSLLRQKQAIQTATLQLNQALSNVPDTNYIVRDTLVIDKNYDFAALREGLMSNNLSIALLNKQNGISMLIEKQIEALRKPRIVLNSAFNLGRQDNTAGLFLVNQNTGLNAGVTLTYPLYDGGNIKRQMQNARIEIESNKLRTQQLQTDLVNTLNLAYQNYQNALAILSAEAENARIARLSIGIAMERFRLSRSTVLELAQIQQSYENAKFRSITAKFEAKMAEIDLMRISGLLIR